MVHFTQGPSYGAYRDYRNHTYARPGQFRMPRPTGSMGKRTTVIIENNGCNCGRSSGAEKVYGWMTIANMALQFLGGLFGGRQKETVQPQNNSQIEALQKEIEELKKQLEEKDQVQAPEGPKANALTDFELIGIFEEEFEEKRIEEKKEETTITVNNTSTKNADGTYNGYTWKSLQDAYRYTDDNGVVHTAPNTQAFRDAFRQQALNGATDIGIGEQHYPKTFEFGGHTYTFYKEAYKPNKYTVSDKYTGTSAHTQKGENTTPGRTEKVSKGWKGTVIATWKDAKGKTQTKTITVSGQQNETAARNEALKQIKEQVPEEFRKNAKFSTNANETK